MVFGRFNPPTTGHEALITFVKSVAHRVNGDVRVYASQSQDPRKNPLPFRNKVLFLRKFFPGVVVSDNTAIRSPFDALAEVSQLGYTDVILVVGSDRVQDFEKFGAYLLPRNSPKYDPNKHIAINNYKVVSVPVSRDPDAEGVSGMSASKMRKFAADNDYTSFRQGVPAHVSERDAKSLFQQVRQYMGLHETFKITTGQFAVGLFEASETFSVTAIENNKVVDQMWDLAKHEFRDAAEMFRKKHPHATLSYMNKSGRVVKVLKPGEQLKEEHVKVGDKVRTRMGDDGVVTRIVGHEVLVNIGPLKGLEHKGARQVREPMDKIRKITEDHLKVGDKVHAGLAQRGGAGFSGVVDRIDGDYVYVNIGKDKYGDRIVKAPHRTVMKEADELSEAPSAMPLRGHAYHRKSDAELLYIIKDAGAAAAAMRGHNPTAEGKYLDQVNDASTVLYYRRHGGKQVTEADGGYTPAKPETETDRLRTSQQQELIALKTRQANQMMAAKLRDVQNKAREAQMKATQPKPAAKPAS